MDQGTSVLKVTPKDFVLWAGAMVTLYASVGALIALLFSYIEYAFPDALSNSYYYGSYDPYSSTIRFSIASLIVLAPAFLILMRIIRADIARVPQKQDLWVRRWALYLTLFVAGAMIAGDLITLVNYFLNGDLTTRFSLKVLVVLALGGGFFLHFLADLRGYWVAQPARAKLVNYGAGAVVLLSIVAGFFIIGSPFDARLYRFDAQKVNDLMTIQSQVANYWQQHENLPATLADLTDPLDGYGAPSDIQTGASYGYRITGTMSFEVCATFNKASRTSDMTSSVSDESWEHGVGEVCFERTIDPERYPPYGKTIPAPVF